MADARSCSAVIIRSCSVFSADSRASASRAAASYPKAYTRPWNVTERLVFLPDTDIIEYMCTENNRYFRLVPDAAPPGAPLGKPGR